MKHFLVFFYVLVFCACISSGPTEAEAAFINEEQGRFSHFITLPNPGSLNVLGVSGRQSSREIEIELAREDAARKVSMFHGVWGSVVAIQEIGHGFFDYFIDTATVIEYDQELEKYFDRLSFNPDRDVTRNNDGTVYINFTYPAAFPGNIYTSFVGNPGGRPEWVSRPPSEISGFIAGVGSSGRQERLIDTMRRSYESAAAAIISQATTSVETTDTVISGQTELHIYRESAGHLSHFTILEVWIDPESRIVWTLAIAQIID